MSDQQFERAVNDWLDDGADRTPPRAIGGVLLAVRTTPQERDLRIPWRFPQMPAFTRATGIAALAVVAVVGAGALAYLGANRPSSVGSQSTSTPTTTPTVALTPGPSFLAPGITGWQPYTSSFYGLQMKYPSGWRLQAPATRAWLATDGTTRGTTWPYADTFMNPATTDGDAIALWVWGMPAGEGADIESVAGLKAWAQQFCRVSPAGRIGGVSSCDAWTAQAIPMCLVAGGDSCRAAIIVPQADGVTAFFMNWPSVMLTSSPDKVWVVDIGRPDEFPAAARYGGSIQLLKSILSTMGVWTPGQQPPS